MAVFQRIAEDVVEQELGPRGIRVGQQQGPAQQQPELAQVGGAQGLILQFAPLAQGGGILSLEKRHQGPGKQRHALIDRHDLFNFNGGLAEQTSLEKNVAPEKQGAKAAETPNVLAVGVQGREFVVGSQRIPFQKINFAKPLLGIAVALIKIQCFF